jgi:hypothetical protein
MPLLISRPPQVKEHWHAVAHALGAILPGGTNTYRAVWEEPAATTATLKCQSYEVETAERQNGMRVPVVPLIAALPGESPVYWISWYEVWVPERRLRSPGLQFQASAVTVYYGVSGESKRQLFRAEWAGVQTVEQQVDVFQGGGAAHPHWHVDAIRDYIQGIKLELERLTQEAVLNRELALDRVRDFGDDRAERDVAGLFLAPQLRLPTEIEMSWTGIHLAAEARWSEQLWPGPEGPHDVHAKGPKDLGAIRWWLTSCVRYIQFEINK